ncbi:MAG: hypothetical protein ACFFAN_13105 [Promethearchaeota archaeon]
MNIKKIPIRPNKIGIDLILCPKTNLYLQDLFCRRCAYYESDNEKFVECGFTGHRYGKSDPIKDKLIKDLSNKFITGLPIEDNAQSPTNFTEQLKAATPTKSNKELLKQDLSNYMKTTNLTTRLDTIKKKKASKESDDES